MSLRHPGLSHLGASYGGLHTTARDLGGVLSGLFGDAPSLLSATSRDAFFSQVQGGTGEEVLAGVEGQLGGERYIGKQGGCIGFSANLRIYPRRGLATVMMVNRTEVSQAPIDARSDRVDRQVLARSWK